MPSHLADASKCVLILVDLQPSFLLAIEGCDRIFDRTAFLVKIANLLEVPVFATEQNPERMGSTDPRLAAFLPQAATFDKMAFSCAGCLPFMERLRGLERTQIVIAGIETHICVSQTALQLLASNSDVFVCPDAVGSRTLDRHQAGLRRMEMAGAQLAHSESIAYEWMKGADHPKFREALAIVKSHS